MNPRERAQLIKRLRSLVAAPPGLSHSSPYWEGRFVPAAHDGKIQERGYCEEFVREAGTGQPLEPAKQMLDDIESLNYHTKRYP